MAFGANGVQSTSEHEAHRARPLLVASTLALVAWGAFAFGANYQWAYMPLFGASIAVGLCGLVRSGSGAGSTLLILGAAAALALAISAQLIPLSQTTLSRVSPATDEILRRYDLAYATAAVHGSGMHPLSIEPRQTGIALFALMSLALLAAGTARMLTGSALHHLARGLVMIGVLLAIVGVIQKPLYAGRIYGFWLPQSDRAPFGPFVNKNHFAGWMLMTLPVAIAYFYSRLLKGPTPRLGLRNRVLWLSSPEANKALLAGFAVFVMAASLVLTLSRSAIVSFGVAITLAGVFVSRQAGLRSKRAALIFLAIVAITAIGWTGLDAVSARFATGDLDSLDGRLAVWKEASRIVRTFPVTGTGVNTFGTASLYFQTADPLRYYDAAHNDYLQLAAEGGILIGLPLIISLVLLAIAIRRRIVQSGREDAPRWLRIGATIGLLAVGLQELSDFSLQIPGNAVLFSVLLGVALSSPDATSSASELRVTMSALTTQRRCDASVSEEQV